MESLLHVSITSFSSKSPHQHIIDFIKILNHYGLNDACSGNALYYRDYIIDIHNMSYYEYQSSMLNVNSTLKYNCIKIIWNHDESYKPVTDWINKSLLYYKINSIL